MSESAESLMWEALPNFSESEFNHTRLDCIDENLIVELQNFRDDLASPVIPSPNSDAWARFDSSKTSRHYAVDRLCDAGDVFVSCSPLKALYTALNSEFGGIGLYLDTQYKNKPMLMLHLDCRSVSDRAIWIRETVKGKQVYTTYKNGMNELNLKSIIKKLAESVL